MKKAVREEKALTQRRLMLLGRHATAVRQENAYAPDTSAPAPSGGNSSSSAVEEAILSQKIEGLKEMAMSLLQEVKALGHNAPAADVKRGVDFYDEVRRFEIDLITRALELTNGHQGRAARLLRLKITTLNSMIKRYGIPTAPAGAEADAGDFAGEPISLDS